MGFLDNIGQSIDLVKDTFVLFKDKPVLMQAPKNLILINLAVGFVIVLCFIGSIFFPPLAFAGFGLLFAAFLIMPFIATTYYAALSWMVFKSFQNEPVTMQDGMKRAKENLADVAGLTIVTLLVNWLASQLRSGKGLLGLILRLIASGIEEGWDIIGNFLLPASIITEKNLIEAAKDAQLLLKNIPAALIGGLAFDSLRGILLALILFPTFFVAFIALYLGFWPLIFIFFGLMFMTYAALSIAISATKVTFFTLLYMKLSGNVQVKNPAAVEGFLNKAGKKKKATTS
jgi:hypothetical protein